MTDFILHRISKTHWIDAIYWLLLSLIGGLLPIWGSYLIGRLISQETTLDLFIRNGELALFCASVISASFYNITKDYLPSNLRTNKIIKMTFPNQSIFILIGVVILIVSVLLFAATSFTFSFDLLNSINNNLIVKLSITITTITIIFSYLIAAIDNSLAGKSEEEIKNTFTASQNKLEQEFDDIRSKEEKSNE